MTVLALASRFLAGSIMQRSFVQPDGSTLTLDGWTYGTHHVLKMRGLHWWQMFQPPREIASLDTDHEVLALWLSHAGKDRWPTGITNFAGNPPDRWWDWVELTDGNGETIRAFNPIPGGRYRLYPPHGLVDSAGVGPAYNGEFLEFYVFPRRGADVFVRFYLADRPSPVAEFRLPNPTPGPFPVWKLQKLPAANRSGPLEVTLLGLEPGRTVTVRRGPNNYQTLPFAQSGIQPMPGEFLPQSARIHITEAGRPTGCRLPLALSFSDVTGNRIDADGLSSLPGDAASGAGAMSMDFLAAFVSHEPQKMHLELLRNAEADYLPSELWRPGVLPLPHRGQVVRSSASITRDGATIRLIVVGGPGQTRWGKADWEAVNTPFYYVRVAYTSPDNNLHLMMRATDSQRRRARLFSDMGPENPPWATPEEGEHTDSDSFITGFSQGNTAEEAAKGPERYRTFGFQPPPGAHDIDLTFAVHKSVGIDFIVDMNPVR